jgi:purine-cytosine permease-like protein
VSDYRDIQTAVRVEKLRIWFAWATGNFLMLVISYGTRNVHIVSVITQVLLIVVFALLTFTAVRMSNALNRKAAARRREVLGE